MASVIKRRQSAKKARSMNLSQQLRNLAEKKNHQIGYFPSVMPGHVSVLNGDAGSISLLYKLASSGLSPHA